VANFFLQASKVKGDVLAIRECSGIRMISKVLLTYLQAVFDQLFSGPAILKPCKIRVVIPNLSMCLE
jgi:hypothetical protein